MDTDFDTLAAWADGESVDRGAVMRALETAEGRDYVVDLMALRRMVIVTTPDETAGATNRARTSHGSRVNRWLVLPAAAAVLCAAAGYTAGRFSVVAADPPDTSIIPVSTPASSSAPAPTHVIRFEAGVDWRETTGGD